MVFSPAELLRFPIFDLLHQPSAPCQPPPSFFLRVTIGGVSGFQNGFSSDVRFSPCSLRDRKSPSPSPREICRWEVDIANVELLYRTNLAIILVMMQVSKRIPFDNPDVLLGVRAMYIISNLIILGIYLYVQAQINKKKGTLAPLLTFVLSYLLLVRSVVLGDQAADSAKRQI